jgi:hypothetical protein
MQFIKGGPDIPDALIQTHEEGRLIFFCGAGISYPAGLPGFKGLVDAVYRAVGAVPNAMELEAYNRNQFDAALDLLERRLPGQRIKVRTAICQRLQPSLGLPGATDTHAAMLQLGRNREGVVRCWRANEVTRMAEAVRA